MKTIYVNEKQWQGRALDRAVGDTGRIAGACLRSAGMLPEGDKVIDLAAWKAENLVELDGQDEPGGGLEQYEGRELVRRPRRRHEAARNWAELAATLSVVGAMAALILRVLLF